MKKRILSILLTLCMMLCLTPISVFAEEDGAWGSAAIQLGADALSVLSKNVNTATAPTVYFGQNHENNPAAWRVIGYDGNGVTSSQGDITLLAAGAMGVIPFVDTILNNEYAPSNLKTAIDALAEKLTTEENAAVKKRALTSGSYDGENTDCVAGGQVDNAVFWPLSAKEAIAVNNDLRALEPAHPNWVTTAWWLRSPGSDKYHLAVVRSDGSVQYSGHTILIFNNHRTVRPAFNLNLNSVLFASAAVGGKPDGGLTEVSEYSGNEWKLTLLDSRRNFAVTEKTADGYPNDTIMLNYSGATIGKNEYISVILADNNGAQYYGRVAQPTAESGTVEIKIPSDIAPGDYTLKVFNEQYNGDYNTDYASNFTDIALTIENRPEQFTLASGGRYYFDLSAMDIPGTVNSNLPDSTLHYVPFTYVGTVDAYSLKNVADKDTTPYEHSLFIADYNVKCSLQRETLAEMNLIYGQTYTASNVNYTLRAPSVGDHHRNEGEGSGLAPIDNEWDTIYQKSADYIKNWYKMRSFGQDIGTGNVEGWYLSRGGHFAAQVTFWARPTLPERDTGFRPVLEVLNPGTLGSGGLKVVTLDLGGGKLGNSSEDIQIIVKTGESFTAPASNGLTRPDENTGSYFMWLDGNGNSYAPGASVPADVTKLTVQWTAPTYTVTLNAGNGTINSGNVTSYTYGVGATLPTDVTRTGYTFKGWYDSKNLTGSPVTAIGDTETGNKEYWAKWEINQYTITVKPENGKADITITQDYGTPITAPADPTREGYTFTGWDRDIPAIMPAENVTVTAKWLVNQYTITFDTAGGSAVASITQDYGTAITAPANPTREGYTFIGWDKAIPSTMPAEDLTITAKWRDIAVPTGEIKIAENGWKSFLNTITFDLFFKDTQTVTVTAADNSGKAVKIEYLLSDKALTESELAGMTFTAYSAPFSINPDNEYVIYVKLTDTSGNFAYINTNGIVLDATVPGISGIADGKTYCAAQIVTVDEKYIGTVKVNGTEVSLDKNGQFVLSPASGKQTIVVTDKAGNETRVTVTVNDGHTYEWQSENGQYWQKCKFCNHETAKKDIPTINISGADKVCRTQDYKFSFTLPEGATGAAYGYKFIGFGDGPLTPTVENGLYSGIIKASAYPAKENSFKLIVSAKTADGFAFSAEKKVTIQNEHTGGTATCKNKAICEVCGESYGKLDPNNHANLKHIDAKAATKTFEGNIEYWYCDGCNKYYKDAKATQEITKAQTVTAKLPPKITAGDGATVTQGEKKELSFTSDASFADFLRVELDGTTLDEKNYTKKEGSTIITLNRDFVATLSVGEHTLAIVSQSGTATAKFTVKAKPAETATPQPTVTPQPTAQPQPTVQPVSPLPRTGDTANPALWFVLLIVSGSALAAIFVLRRKDNRK